MSKSRWTFGLGLGCSIGAFACGDDDDGGGAGRVTTTAALGKATVQIVAQVSGVSPLETAEYEAFGAGTGFIIDPSGIVVTNNHVVAGAAGLRVFINEQPDPVNARVLARSECNDLAVLDLEGDGYNYLAWYQGSIARGLEVQAVGYPLGDPTLTLTQGIISKPESPFASSWASVTAALEHDARINQGNSGGPLIEPRGFRVVGVNYAGNTETDQNFAISISEARPIVEQLRAGVDVDSVGINGVALDLEEVTGVWVESTTAGSPASEAGIQPGDFVTKVAGIAAGRGGTMEDFCQAVRTRGSDGVIEIEVYRPSTDQFLAGEFNGRPLSSSTAVGVASDPNPMEVGVTPGGRDGGEIDGSSDPVCVPGELRACAGPSACSGQQSCLADGSGFGVCDCGGTETPATCSNTCASAGNEICEDGRAGAASSACQPGTDCSDCEPGTEWFSIGDTASDISCDVINGADFEAIVLFPGAQLLYTRRYGAGGAIDEIDTLDTSAVLDANRNIVVNGQLVGFVASFASDASGNRRLWAFDANGVLINIGGLSEFAGLTPTDFTTAACNACGGVDQPHPTQLCP